MMGFQGIFYFLFYTFLNDLGVKIINIGYLNIKKKNENKILGENSHLMI